MSRSIEDAAGLVRAAEQNVSAAIGGIVELEVVSDPSDEELEAIRTLLAKARRHLRAALAELSPKPTARNVGAHP